MRTLNRVEEEKLQKYNIERIFKKTGTKVFVLWENYTEPSWVDVKYIQHLSVYKDWVDSDCRNVEESSEEESSEEEVTSEEEGCEEEGSEVESSVEETEAGSETEEDIEDENTLEEESCEEENGNKRKRTHYWRSLSTLNKDCLDGTRKKRKVGGEKKVKYVKMGDIRVTEETFKQLQAQILQ